MTRISSSRRTGWGHEITWATLGLMLLWSSTAAGQTVAVNGNRAAIGATNRVIIASYVVEFQKQVSGNASSSRFFGAGRVNSVVADNNLVGVESAVLQRITDTGYTQLVEQLTAAGFVVVPAAEYAGLPDWKKLAEKAFKTGDVFDNLDGQSWIFGASGTPSYVPDLESGDRAQMKKNNTPLVGGLLTGLQQASTVVNALSDPYNIYPTVESRLAKATNAHVLKIWQFVNFGTVKATAGMTNVSSGATASLFLNGLDSRLSLRTPQSDGVSQQGKAPEHVVNPGGLFQKRVVYTPPNDGDVVVRLKDDIAAGAAFMAGPIRDATTTSEKIGTALTVVGALLTQTGGVTNYKTYETPADPVKFEAIVSDMLKSSQAAYVAALK